MYTTLSPSRLKATARHNSRMRAAIDEYREQELKPDVSDRLSYRAVADKHDMSKSTLQCLVNGGISMSAFNASKQRLTPAEERIVEIITADDENG